jgi:hypothetical protein
MKGIKKVHGYMPTFIVKREIFGMRIIGTIKPIEKGLRTLLMKNGPNL